MKQKVLVTGASGFVGSALVKRLISDGYIVHAASTHDPHLKEFEHPNLTYFEVNLLDKESLRESINGCDIVFHVAGCTKVWTESDKEYFDINVQGTINLLELSVEHHIQKFLFTSSAGVYGPSNGKPIRENSIRIFDFFNAYESSKAIAESFVKTYVIRTGLDAVILSPTRVYGPSIIGHPATVNKLVSWYIHGKWRIIPGNGKKIGNYVFIDDVVEAQINAIKHGKKGETYIIGGENLDYNTFFEVLSEVSGIKRTMFHVPQWLQMFIARIQLVKTWFGISPVVTPKWTMKGEFDWEIDSSKAQSELKYTPTGIKEGIQKTASWLSEIDPN